MKRRHFLSLSLAALAPFARAGEGAFLGRPEVEAFIDETAAAHGFARDELERFFAQLTINEDALDLISRPADPKRKLYWRDYRERFLNKKTIAGGADFMRRNESALHRAEDALGVPPHITAAIIGVETKYGANTGRFRVAEALASLGFNYPQTGDAAYAKKRAAFFRGELSAFLVYARENDINPLSPRGSYAGAMGIAQFMPTSLNNFAVDFDGDGAVDLFAASDAVGSVANFLSEHGWRRGLAVNFPAQANGDVTALLKAGVKPTLSKEEMEAGGITFLAPPPPGIKFALIDLEEKNAPPEYRAGTDNFYTLTRYNRSHKYAAAVADLSEAILRRMGG
jgi:membrane-bound lytic murein transglycosylase B